MNAALSEHHFQQFNLPFSLFNAQASAFRTQFTFWNFSHSILAFEEFGSTPVYSFHSSLDLENLNYSNDAYPIDVYFLFDGHQISPIQITYSRHPTSVYLCFPYPPHSFSQGTSNSFGTKLPPLDSYYRPLSTPKPEYQKSQWTNNRMHFCTGRGYGHHKLFYLMISDVSTDIEGSCALGWVSEGFGTFTIVP
jgi:hypothetical protein